jgi:hypothetical protein
MMGSISFLRELRSCIFFFLRDPDGLYILILGEHDGLHILYLRYRVGCIFSIWASVMGSAYFPFQGLVMGCILSFLWVLWWAALLNLMYCEFVMHGMVKLDRHGSLTVTRRYLTLPTNKPDAIMGQYNQAPSIHTTELRKMCNPTRQMEKRKLCCIRNLS